MSEASDRDAITESWKRAAEAGPFPDEALIYDNRPTMPPGWRYGMPRPPAPQPWWRRMLRKRSAAD